MYMRIEVVGIDEQVICNNLTTRSCNLHAMGYYRVYERVYEFILSFLRI